MTDKTPDKIPDKTPEPVQYYPGLVKRTDQWDESIYGENKEILSKPLGAFNNSNEYVKAFMAKNYGDEVTTNDYTSFWQDPVKLARYKLAIDNLPPGMDAPEWYNKATVDKAWAYMSAYNPGKYWYEWTPLSPTDPLNSELQGLRTPPLEAIPDRDWANLKVSDVWTKSGVGNDPVMQYLVSAGLGDYALASTQVATALTDYENGLSGTYQPAALDADITGTAGMDDATYQALPWWKKALVWVGNSGVAGSAAQAGASGAVMGLLTNGIPGAIAGGALGSGLGAGAAATSESMPWLAKALNVLDLPAEGLERTVGLLAQMGVAALEDIGENEGNLQAILDDLPSAWKAASLTYEAAGTNISGGKVDYLDQAKAVQLEKGTYGIDALKEARQMIADGASLDDVRTAFQQRFGVTGQMYDLAGHMLADPLNLIPAAGLAMGSKIATKTGNTVLQTAFEINKMNKGWRESDGIFRVLTKTYPTLLRQNMAEAAKIPGKFGDWSRWMAGIDLDMNGKPTDHWFTPEGQAQVRKKRLFALTPEARAEESASNILLHLGLQINDAVDAKSVTKIISQMASTDTNIAAQVGDGSWANTAEASAFPVLMRDTVKKLPELEDALWNMNETDRNLFTTLAKAAGIDVTGEKAPVDINTFMKEIAKSPDNVLAKIKQGLKVAADGGNADATRILASFSDPNNPLKGIDLQKRAKKFIDGDAVMTLDEYKARVTAYVTENIEKALVNWFDVKPDKWIYRLSSTIKNTQSIMLLGSNPMYFVNNALNNIVTQAFSGVLGFSGKKANDAFWKRLGVDSPRRTSGVGAADIAGMMGRESPIESAKKAKGTLSAIDNFARSVNKFMPFTKLSQIAEKASSDVATTVAGKKAWYAIHKAGVGFDKMSKPTEQMMRNMGIEPAVFYAAIENGMNPAEIEKNLWDNVTYNYLSQVASPEQMKLLQDVGVYDTLSTRLRNSKTASDIEDAFRETNRDLVQQARAIASANTVANISKWYGKVVTEGSQAAYEAFDKALSEYGDFFSSHQKQLDDFYASMESITDVKKKRKLKEDFFNKADSGFKLQRQQRDSMLVGVCQALMGNGSQHEVKLTDYLLQASELHDGFFGTRKRIWQDFFNAYDGDTQAITEFTKSVTDVLGEERVTELQTQFADKWMYRAAQETNRVNYRNTNVMLDDIQLDIDNLFVDMFEKHYPGGRNAAIAWRANARFIQQVMTEAEDYFRHGAEGNELAKLGKTGLEVQKKIDDILGGSLLADLDHNAQNAMWNKYHAQVKQPLIADQVTASKYGDVSIMDAAAGVKKIEVPTKVVESPNKVVEPALKQVGEAEYNAAPVDARMKAETTKQGQTETQYFILQKDFEKVAKKNFEVDAKTKKQTDEVRNMVKQPDRYIVNIVNKYGEKKVKNISEITPEMAQKALDERTRVKAEEAKIIEGEPAKVEEPVAQVPVMITQAMRQQLKDKGFTPDQIKEMTPQQAWDNINAKVEPEPIVEVKPARTAEELQNIIQNKALNLDAIQKNSHGLYNREAFVRDLVDVFELPQEQADGVMAVLDGITNYWSRRTGKPAEQWWTESIQEIVKGEEGQLKQDSAYAYGQLDSDQMAGYALSLSHQPDQIKKALEWERPADRLLLLDALYKINPDLAKRVAKETKGTLWQQAKGAVSWVDDGKAVISALEGKDVSTAIHEVAHVWLRTLPGVADDDIATVTKWLRDEYKLELDDDWVTQDDVTKFREAHELFARAFEKYLQEGKAPRTELQQVFDSFKQWLTDIYRKVRGLDDVNLTDDMRAMFDKWVGEADDSPLPDGLDYAPERPMGKGALYQIADNIDTPEFKNWFGDSKVVDADGKPLVVYHGTQHEFTEFSGVSFFTEDPEYASEIASLKWWDKNFSADKGLVMPVYIRMENPLTVVMKDSDFSVPEKEFPIIEKAKNDGVYDGVIFVSEKSRDKYYVTFSPEQIKSTFNRGTFDPNNPNILFQEAEPIKEVNAVAGTIDSLVPPPQGEAVVNGILNKVNPVLNELHMKYLQADATTPKGGLIDQMRGGIKKTNPGITDVEIDNLLTSNTKEIRKYLSNVYQQMKGEKLATMKMGLQGRDYALLNYNQRTNFDTYMGAVFPYEFWYTKSMLNWAARGLDRPAMLANYSRLRKFQSELGGKDGMPYRLRHKSFIELPFLPEWMGEGVYFDPLKQIYPIEMMTRPFEQMASQKNTQVKKAQTILHQWESEGEADSTAVTEALQKQSGELWEKAMAQADIETEDEIENPFDFAQTMIGTSLPINYAYQLAMGRPERISQLPITRFIQAMTGMAGIGGAAGVNIEAPIRKAVGLPEMDRYYDYRVNRMLAGMAAEGTITADQAQEAMVGQSGAVFEQAQGRVAKMGFWQYMGAPLGVDFFPEGEQEQRAIKKEYSNAIDAWKAGDDKALTTFFDKYPEYEAQMLAWKDPEEQLRRFLISEVWDRYNELPTIHKKQVEEQFGDTFSMAFLDKETRSYDAIEPETLAMWAQMLNGFVPKEYEQATLPLKLADDETANAVDAYYAERKAKFGGSYETEAYSKWRNAYLAKHPEIISWVQNEQSELYNVSPEIQQQVYQYRAMKDAYYPTIYQVQEEYYAQSKENRKAYLEVHPELADYWDWRKQMAALYPKAATYILSDAAVSQALTDEPPYSLVQITRNMSGELYRQFMGYLYADEKLSSGGLKELKRLWEKAGEPEGDMDTWLEQAKASL